MNESKGEDRSSRQNAATVVEPKEGDTITRVVVTETTYVWRVDVDGVGDWYAQAGPHTRYEHPKWKDVPGAS